MTRSTVWSNHSQSFLRFPHQVKSHKCYPYPISLLTPSHDRSVFVTFRDANASYIFPLFAKALHLMPNVRTIRISWDLTIHSCSLLGEYFRGISLSSVQSFAVPAMFIRWGSSFPSSMRLTTSPSYNLLKGMSLEKVDSLHMSLSPHCIRSEDVRVRA